MIRKYSPADEAVLMAMIEKEGEEWIDYYGSEGRKKYQKALDTSLVYLAFEGEALCGYCRCRDDGGFGIYILDLLVDRDFRGREIGRRLMERVCRDHPKDIVYVTSGVDPYYEKLGYRREGTIFQIVPKKE